MKIRKPMVTLRCPANAYTPPRERIVEFSVVADDGKLYGGLLSLRNTGDGLRLSLYRLDEGVTVQVDPERVNVASKTAERQKTG